MADRSLAVRSGLIVSSLVLAAVLLLGFKSPDELDQAGAARGGTLAAGPTTTPAATPTAEPRGGRNRAGSSPGTGSNPGATAAPAPVGVAGGQTYTGTLIQTRFGPVQIQVTVANGTINDVEAVRLPTGGRSGAISSYAGPILRSEALTAKSASIQIVSGATYTSRAYESSLQAALDQVHG